MSSGVQDLPYMPAADLEGFIHQNRDELGLTPSEETYLRIRRRRLSIERASTQGKVQSLQAPDRPRMKLVVLGTEGLTNHGESFTSYMEKDVKVALRCGDLSEKTVEYTSSTGTVAVADIQAWLVPSDPGSKQLRSLFFSSTTAFIVFFSVKSRSSFEDVTNVWLPEIAAHSGSSFVSPPVVLVGTHAQCRNALPETSQLLVTAQEAIALARTHSVSKYIEVFSDNVHHIHEVVQQAIQASLLTYGVQDLGMLDPTPSLLDDDVFRDQLTLGKPVCEFDLYDRVFKIDMDAANVGIGARYYVTFDDTNALEYTDPIKLVKPYPRTIRVVCKARCRYASDPVVLHVPSITPSPIAHFDVLTGTFVVHTLPDTKYYYTLDGSKPHPSTSRLYTNVLVLSGGHVGTSGHSGPMFATPDDFSVRVVAMGPNAFRSKVSDYKPPPALDAPKVTFNAAEGVLCIDTVPYLEYRYTLDGSTPTYDVSNNPSTFIYSRPILIPKEKYINVASGVAAPRVRVMTFPRMNFPSRIVEVPLVAQHVPSSAVVHMTKTSLHRIQQGHANRAAQQRSLTPTGKPPGSPHLAPGSRRASPARVSSPGPRRSTPANTSTTTTNNNNNNTSNSNKNVVCNAQDNVVEFEFESPIQLSHVTVTTPGYGKGPSSYEIQVMPHDESRYITVGVGSLEDLDGLQKMVIPASSSQYVGNVARVRCLFMSDFNSQNTFQICDMKVHGRPKKPQSTRFA
eukprot:PhF_6_TR26157/c1_g1_i2/m.37093